MAEGLGTTAGLVTWATLILGCPAAGQESGLPRTIQLGASLGALRQALSEDCTQTEELFYEGEMAAPFDEQIQINCSGLEVFRVRRNVEFMFNDGALGHVWIHVRGEEIEELRRVLEQSFGQVVHETELDHVFASGTVALRRRPPEILVATPALIAELTGYAGDGR